MALTKDLIKSQAALSMLTDEQVAALEVLSKNDEDAAIDKRFGEVYRSFDEKIENFLGVKRDGAEKTYLYFERAAKAVKEKADEAERIRGEHDAIKAEKERLEKIVSEGAGNEEVAKKLKQAEADLAATKESYNTLKGEYDGLTQKHESEILTYKKNTVFSEAMRDIKLKSEYPKELLDTAVKNALEKVKGLPSEFIKGTDGKESLVFRTEDGKTMTNQANGLNPFTAAELLTNELKHLGVLDEGRKQNGAGTKAGNSSNNSTSVDVSGARTKGEADKIIQNSLLQQGLVRGSSEFQSALDAAWKDNKVAELPME